MYHPAGCYVSFRQRRYERAVAFLVGVLVGTAAALPWVL